MNGLRLWALASKEATQLVRDRATLGMLLGVPTLQLLLFGFAIELTPRTLPVTVVATSPAAHALVRLALDAAAVKARVDEQQSLTVARESMMRGEALVVVDADRQPVRVEIDGTNPVLAEYAKAAVDRFARVLADADGGFTGLANPVQVRVMFNPEARSQPFLVSGLLGLILTMTLVMMSALSVARERERGTLEGLMVLGVRPLELLAGKLAPYFLLGLVQGALVLGVARWAFGVSVQGSSMLLATACGLFAFANLALGFLFSSLARAQMPAMQMTFFFFLPSSLLSGFMFPFTAMPAWAQAVGSMLPLTHFLRIVRGIALRGVDATFVVRELVPIAAFAVTVALGALWSCRRALRRGPS